ncbi:MAG TPA: demethoxyubiquinone hydroxylase family protein, partial [Gammaproteobacteria bacterium]|nr:demethoxyubiquinone hydroxylase family protein [Gammaproteobacteria bacterium]
LPEKDLASRAVVDAMKEDEQQHGETAHQAGSADLPIPVKSLMRLASRVMTGTAHWI